MPNLKRLASVGGEGEYGFYEAIDYTTSRLPVEQSSAVIRTYMAHHQGMGMLAMADQPEGQSGSSLVASGGSGQVIGSAITRADALRCPGDGGRRD